MGGEIDLRQIDPENLYTLAQTVEFLRCSYSTILNIKKKGGFPTTKISNRIYVKGADIIRYVEGPVQQNLVLTK